MAIFCHLCMRKSSLEHMLRIYAGYELPKDQAGPVEMESFPTSGPDEGMERPGFIDLDDDTQIEATESISDRFVPDKSWKQNPISSNLDTFNSSSGNDFGDDKPIVDYGDEDLEPLDVDSDEPHDEHTVVAAFKSILRKSAGRYDPWHYPHRTAEEYNQGDFAKLTNEVANLSQSIGRRIRQSAGLSGGLFRPRDAIKEFITRNWWPKDLPGFEDSGEVVRKALLFNGDLSAGMIQSDSYLRERDAAYDDLARLYDEINAVLPEEKLNLGDYQHKDNEALDPNKEEWDL